ncbi:MAG: type I-C CRISPR-associated protein Cas8c/Csd1 [Ardenticatenaceae bacterium]|nr:type I-C CRISPR-associated protein Cas8c/Csd1 [Ardenticatenaceae bacterium]
MSWMQKLYETYNNCEGQIGYSNNEKERPLLPICHITTQAQIEIAIDGAGNFLRARLITDKREASTIVPSTESSASRAGSKPANHPLCDKLQYIAGDFRDFGGSVTSGFAKEVEEPYRSFVEMLKSWCQSEFSHPKAEAVLKYVEKKTVVQDLAKQKIVLVGDDGKFLAKKEVQREKDTADIFSVINDQEQAFVRWVVEIPGDPESEIWKDKTLWDSWMNFYLSDKTKEPFCYVTGKTSVLTANHPKYLRREGDGAKLISSNDTSGFTFRGRFLTDAQACNVSLEVSQKAHYALLWLISRQGYRKDDQAIVAWATSGAELPQPTDDPTAFLDESDLVSDEPSPVDIRQDLAIKLKKKIAGYSQKIDATTDVVVMGLDSATPGRLAITYYRELNGSDFLQRLDHWHETCTWLHRYRANEIVDRETGKTKYIYPPFVGAPAPKDIAEAAYATNRNGKLEVSEEARKSTVERILPCIIDGQPIPKDIVVSTVRKASNRVALEDWQWRKTLSIACALYKKNNEKENYSMSLEPTRTTRDYLYGRLLALADSLEEWALNEANEGRQTNAARLMQRFAERPFSTWRTIELALTPYKARLGGKSKKRQWMIDEVMALFDPDDFTNDKPLSGEFLLGYHSQREFLRPQDSQQQDENQENIEN